MAAGEGGSFKKKKIYIYIIVAMVSIFLSLFLCFFLAFFGESVHERHSHATLMSAPPCPFADDYPNHWLEIWRDISARLDADSMPIDSIYIFPGRGIANFMKHSRYSNESRLGVRCPKRPALRAPRPPPFPFFNGVLAPPTPAPSMSGRRNSDRIFGSQTPISIEFRGHPGADSSLGEQLIPIHPAEWRIRRDNYRKEMEWNEVEPAGNDDWHDATFYRATNTGRNITRTRGTRGTRRSGGKVRCWSLLIK